MNERWPRLVAALWLLLAASGMFVVAAGGMDVDQFKEDVLAVERAQRDGTPPPAMDDARRVRLAGYLSDPEAARASLDILAGTTSDPLLRSGATKISLAYCRDHVDDAICPRVVDVLLRKLMDGERDPRLEATYLRYLARADHFVASSGVPSLPAFRRWLRERPPKLPLDEHGAAALLLQSRVDPDVAANNAIQLLQESAGKFPATDLVALRAWVRAGRNNRPDVVVKVLENTEDDTDFVAAAVALGHQRSSTGFVALVKNLTRRAKPSARAALRLYQDTLPGFLRSPSAEVRCLAAVAAWSLDRRDLVDQVRRVADEGTPRQKVVLHWIVEDLGTKDGPWKPVTADYCIEEGGR